MKKTPTLFVRNFDKDPSLVTQTPNPVCEWVFNGEGIATKKIDGTAVLIRYESGDKVNQLRYFKRYEVKAGKTPPPGFEAADNVDSETGKQPGWVPVTDGPEDKYHNLGYQNYLLTAEDKDAEKFAGTYELVGPKIQQSGYDVYTLVPHTVKALALTEPLVRTYEGIRDYLTEHSMEGLVYHHPDGRRAKIKSRDFGIEWPRK